MVSGQRRALTPRELEILRFTAFGYPDRIIATRVGLSETTIKTYQTRLRKKLKARDRTHAVAMGYEAGFIRTGTIASNLALPGAEQRILHLEEQVTKLINVVNAITKRRRKRTLLAKEASQ